MCCLRNVLKLLRKSRKSKMTIKKLFSIYLITFISSIYFYVILLDTTVSDNNSVSNLSAKLISFAQSLCVCAVLSVIAWVLSNKIYDYYTSNNGGVVCLKNRAILITGCDSGFGKQLAIKCDALGISVFAGVLFPERSDLSTICSERLKVVKLDVTNADEVCGAIQAIKQSNLQLWAVVNNAGISLATPFGWGRDVDSVEKTFAVNVFGAMRVTKHCLPLLCESKGRVINMSSIAGLVTPPAQTTYCMSKHALRSFSDGLRRELTELGVKVVTIEPNLYHTPIINYEPFSELVLNIWNETPKDIQLIYGDSGPEKYFERLKLYITSARTQTSEVIDALVSAITLKEPKSYYRCAGAFDLIWLWFFCSSPTVIQDFVYYYGYCNITAYKLFIKTQRIMSFNKCVPLEE